MATPQEELVESIKKLYNNAEFSDLDILSSVKRHKCHKAVVCPRSPYLAQKCHEANEKSQIWAEETDPNSISLEDVDSHALDLVIEYLYLLDYCADRPHGAELEELVHYPNGTGKHLSDADGGVKLNGTKTNGHVVNDIAIINGSTRDSDQDATRDRETSPSARTETTTEPLDDFLSIPATMGKKAKKRQKRKTINETIAERPKLDAKTAGSEEATAMTRTNTTVATQMNAKEAEQVLRVKALDIPESDRNAAVLTIHAKVYALSSSFQIAGLSSLALSKFQALASGDKWDAADFLAAANEAYGMPETEVLAKDFALAPEYAIKQVVLSTMVRHPELLDHVDMETIGVERPKLMIDLLRRMRDNGK